MGGGGIGQYVTRNQNYFLSWLTLDPHWGITGNEQNQLVSCYAQMGTLGLILASSFSHSSGNRGAWIDLRTETAFHHVLLAVDSLVP